MFRLCSELEIVSLALSHTNEIGDVKLLLRTVVVVIVEGKGVGDGDVKEDDGKLVARLGGDVMTHRRLLSLSWLVVAVVGGACACRLVALSLPLLRSN